MSIVATTRDSKDGLWAQIWAKHHYEGDWDGGCAIYFKNRCIGNINEDGTLEIQGEFDYVEVGTRDDGIPILRNDILSLKLDDVLKLARIYASYLADEPSLDKEIWEMT